MTQMQINGSETGVLRLFALDLPPEAVERFVTQAGTGEWPLKYAFGAKELRASFVDVINISDLGDMPLTQYLIEAHGAAGADFKAAMPQVNAQRGHVLAVPSQAFANTSQTLAIATPLRWIGTFSEVKAKPRGAVLRSLSAKGQTAAGAGAQSEASTSPILKIVLIVIALAALGLLAMALI